MAGSHFWRHTLVTLVKPCGLKWLAPGPKGLSSRPTLFVVFSLHTSLFFLSSASLDSFAGFQLFFQPVVSCHFVDSRANTHSFSHLASAIADLNSPPRPAYDIVRSRTQSGGSSSTGHQPLVGNPHPNQKAQQLRKTSSAKIRS